ncbi:ABC transporter substrate-binding protein [Rhodococcus sp. APC 3903]|uniref:ABC transporter substrate-binding protein n=1 Tax=Rhodococcus sp. APC 3903 TaxID=3035193 RepID=UPI0025B28F9C|nr:ABC transporter substrate-binding protein [Rhodococcus sp. APC 3903]MDN3460819.1 ABC transporter substrate-binding protein [Rhodococcus sp. APC 3903]
MNIYTKIVLSTALAALVLPQAGCSLNTPPPAEHTITIEHSKGSTALEAVPQRIVALSTSWADTVLAFGHRPVGIGVITGITTTGGHYPWQGRYEAATVKLSLLGAPAYEDIAALEPDLILADYSARDDGVYDRLTSIAPTVAPLAASGYVDPWRKQVETAGAFLGEQVRASELIANTDTALTALADEHAHLSGKTFAIATATQAGMVGIVASNSDPAVELFTEIGMRLPEQVIDLAGPAPRLIVSLENALPALHADLILLRDSTEMLPNRIPGWEELPAVRTGAVLFLDGPLTAALSDPSVLSIDYLFSHLESKLTAIP